MWFCDPPGRSDPQSLLNFGQDIDYKQHYILLHDQEPIHLEIHRALFDAVQAKNSDIEGTRLLITSETQSEFLDCVCKDYGYSPFYYFFHGWAALDWYRGYDKTFLIAPPEHRQITHSFVSANRIIGGLRSHRIMLMYYLLKNKISNAWISFPEICPAEKQHILDLSKNFGEEVQDVFRKADLPLCFPDETDHPMQSCWLDLFDENASSLAHVITETVYSGRRYYLTEKTFKPICLRTPFVMVSTAGSLEYLRRYGFRTFADVWDETYDLEQDDNLRLKKISCLLKQLDDQSPKELQQMYRATIPVLEHNFQHFYGGNFERILWQELTEMLDAIKICTHVD
jgi:hypothetical protein